jgi:NhaP-type Na+/H+ or K+/H+ antiporter
MKPSIFHIKSRVILKKLIDTLGIVFAVFLAAVLGNYVARIITKPIHSALAIYVIGISVGLFVGFLVGIYFKRGWGKWVGRIEE